MYFSENETSDYYVNDTDMSISKDCDESQTEKVKNHTSSCNLLPFTSICHKRSSSDALHNPSVSSSPISNCLPEDSKTLSTPSLNSHELDSSDKPCTSKKHKICETPKSRSSTIWLKEHAKLCRPIN